MTTDHVNIEIIFNKMGAICLENEKKVVTLTPVQMNGMSAVLCVAMIESEGTRGFILDNFDCAEIWEEIHSLNERVRPDNYYILLMSNGMCLTFYLRTEGDIKLTWSLDWEVDEVMGVTEEFEFVLNPQQWATFEKVFADD